MVPNADAELKVPRPVLVLQLILAPSFCQPVGGEHVGGDLQKVQVPSRNVIDIPDERGQADVDVVVR